MIVLAMLVGVMLASLFAITVVADGSGSDPNMCPDGSHGYWAIKTMPSKSAEGTLIRTCEDCDYTETLTNCIPKLTAGNYINQPDRSYECTATCTQSGKETFVYKKDGQNFSFTLNIDALGHDMGAWVNTKEPTCTEKGLGRRDCKRCHYYETCEIDKNAHTFGSEWVTDGSKHWHVCECGEKSNEANHTDPLDDGDHECDVCGKDNVTDHTYSNKWITDGDKHWHVCECGEKSDVANHTGGEATCVKAASCEVCAVSYGVKDLTNHTYGDLVGVVEEEHSATALSPRVEAHYHCACGKYFTKGKVATTLNALTGGTPAHTYGKWQTTATKHWKECSCGKVIEESAHDFAIVSHEGHLRRKCNTCGYFDRNDYYQFNGVSGDALSDKDLLTPELKSNNKLNSAEKIEQVLRENLQKLLQNSSQYLSTTLYNVTLQYWDTSKKAYVPASSEHFPADGKMQVTLPLDGIVSNPSNVYVIHMFSVTAHGKVAGDTEIFTVGNGLTVDLDKENNQTLLTFTVTGLSPVMVGFGCADHVDADLDHKCDRVGCTYDLVGTHGDPDRDHVCNYCKNEMSACLDADQNHLCDICCVTLGECVDADEDGVCDVCNVSAEEDKTRLLLPLMILFILMVVFCTGTIYFLLQSKKTACVTKSRTSAAKKNFAVVPKTEKKTDETVVEVCEEELIFPELVEAEDEFVAEKDTAETESSEVAEQSSEATVEEGDSQSFTTEKLVKIAKKSAPIVLSALVVTVAAVTLYKASQKRQKSRDIELITKFFR